MFKKVIKHRNTSAKVSALLCLVCGASLFILAGNGFVVYPAAAQLISIALIAASIYIASAYLLREYTYAIEPNTHVVDDDDLSAQYDLIITEAKGKKQVKVCHIEMSEITGVRVIDPNNRKQIQSERKDKKRYTYDTCFAASRQIEILSTIDGEDYSIIVSYDEEFLQSLSKFGK